VALVPMVGTYDLEPSVDVISVSFVMHTATHWTTLQHTDAISVSFSMNLWKWCESATHTLCFSLPPSLSPPSRAIIYAKEPLICAKEPLSYAKEPLNCANKPRSAVLGYMECTRRATLCCSVLQCVAVCCRVLQCVAVCCSVLQCVAVCCSVLQCVAVY